MRRFVFANEEIYHIFNRSIEQKPVFIDKRECLRASITFDYYRFASASLRLSKALLLERIERQNFFDNLIKNGKLRVEIISYCLMPNHFHFLLKQKEPNGISNFTGDFTNSYTKYFNTKHKRAGPLFQGTFKVVRIESDEQLIHTSRYIHLNPVTSFVIPEVQLDSYPWSSLPEYLGTDNREICSKEVVLDQFSSQGNYRSFVHDQINYARDLDKIKHLILE